MEMCATWAIRSRIRKCIKLRRNYVTHQFTSSSFTKPHTHTSTHWIKTFYTSAYTHTIALIVVGSTIAQSVTPTNHQRQRCEDTISQLWKLFFFNWLRNNFFVSPSILKFAAVLLSSIQQPAFGIFFRTCLLALLSIFFSFFLQYCSLLLAAG